MAETKSFIVPVCHVTAATAVFSTMQYNFWHNLYNHTEFNQQLSREARLTNAMNGYMICILSGSSVDWSNLSIPLVTLNNLEMVECSLPDSYICFKNQKQPQKPQWLVNSRVKAISSIYSYLLSFGLGQGCSKPCYFFTFSLDSLAPFNYKKKRVTGSRVFLGEQRQRI